MITKLSKDTKEKRSLASEKCKDQYMIYVYKLYYLSTKVKYHLLLQTCATKS